MSDKPELLITVVTASLALLLMAIGLRPVAELAWSWVDSLRLVARRHHTVNLRPARS